MGRYSILIVMMLLAAPLQAQTTSLRQGQLFEGDIAELTITYDARVPSLYALDTTPLQADFEVLERRSRIFRLQLQQQNLYRMEWKVFMLPRRSGKLAIPALKIGNIHSEALSLEVNRADAETRARQHAFVEIEAFPRNPYPGQQTRIVMRLLHNMPSLEGTLIEPEFAAAQVFRGADDLNYQTTRDGRRFTVLERSILITADSAGPMQAAAASFRGRVDALRSTSMASGETTTKRYIYRRSESLQLQVRELPTATEPAGWLPAKQLQMDLQWDQSVATLRVGESLGLTLTLRATGLPGEALPANLLLRNPGLMRIFADREIRETRVEHSARGPQLSGILRQRYAIVLDRAGEVTLPRLRLPWWDVDADVAREAILPPISLQVIEAETGAIPADDRTLYYGAATGPARGLAPQTLTQHWRWLALLLLGALLLPLSKRLQPRLAGLLRRTRQRRQSLRRLRKACLAGDADAAHPALIAWARLHWQNRHLSGLRSIARLAGTRDWREQLALLDAARFAAGSPDWSGEILWSLVRQHADASARRGSVSQGRLPDLYPAASRSESNAPGRTLPVS